MKKLMMTIILLGALMACTTNIPEQQIPQPPGEENPPPIQEQVTIPETITPQLSKIAFVRDFGIYYGMEICTMDSDGANIQRVTNASGNDSYPKWSPDGTKILFESTREGHSLRSIYVMDANGENIKCLTPEAQNCRLPAWSPDGEKIAYCTMEDIGGISRGGAVGRVFVPDDIFIMNSDGSNKQYFMDGWTPCWLSDSQHIASVSYLSHEIRATDIESLDTESYRVYAGGLRFPMDNFPTLAVSPDGKSVAFDYWKLNRCDICVISLETGEIKNLTSNFSGNSYCPTWAPYSTKIAFTTETGEKVVNIDTVQIVKETAIYIIDMDGNNPTLLIENGTLPSWQRGGMKNGS